MARPLVGHRELRLDRRILLAEFRETRPHPFQRRLSPQSFAGRSGAGEKRLDLPQLLAQLGFGRHRLASSLSLQSKALHSARPTSISFTPAIHFISKAQTQLPCSRRDAFEPSRFAALTDESLKLQLETKLFGFMRAI